MSRADGWYQWGQEYFRFIEAWPFNTDPRADACFIRYTKRICFHSAHGMNEAEIIATRMRKARIEYSTC